jgi:predicted lactoylglutathione lyase
MKAHQEKKELNEIEKIKNFLLSLGFISNSDSSSDNKIFSKNGNVIIIKENREK